MKLTDAQAMALARALDFLTHGHSGRFEDELWLGFGDEWWPLRERLLKHGYIRRLGGLKDAFAVTERGTDLLDQISGNLKAVG
jgi:hypothetical protein